MRLLLAGAALVLTVGCSVPYDELVCVRPITEADCIAVGDAAARAFGDGQRLALVAVQDYRHCPPGTFCQQRRLPGPAPLSALVGVRLADGTTMMGSVLDIEARPIVVEVSSGYDADHFIDLVINTSDVVRP